MDESQESYSGSLDDAVRRLETPDASYRNSRLQALRESKINQIRNEDDAIFTHTPEQHNSTSIENMHKHRPRELEFNDDENIEEDEIFENHSDLLSEGNNDEDVEDFRADELTRQGTDIIKSFGGALGHRQTGSVAETMTTSTSIGGGGDSDPETFGRSELGVDENITTPTRSFTELPTETAVAKRIEKLRLDPDSVGRPISTRIPGVDEALRMGAKEQAATMVKALKDVFNLKTHILFLEKRMAKTAGYDTDKQIVDLQLQNRDLKLKLREMKDELKQLRRQKREGSQSEVAELRSKVAMYEDQLQNNPSQAHTNDLVLALQNDNEKLLQEINDLKLDNLHKERAASDPSQTETHEHFENTIRGYEEQTRRLRQDLKAMRQELHEVRTDRDAVFGIVEQAKVEADDLQRDYDEAQTIIEQLQGDADEAREMVEEMDIAKRSLEEELHAIDAELQYKEESAELQKRENDKLIRQLHNLQGVIQDMQYNQKVELERQAELSPQFGRDETESLAAHIDELKQQIRSLERNLDAEMSLKESAAESSRIEIKKLRDELWDLRRNTNSQESESKNILKDLNKLGDVIRQTLNVDVNDNEGLRAALLNLKETIDTLKNDAIELKADLADRDRSLKERENTMENMTQELKKVTDRLERERTSRQSLTNELQELKSIGINSKQNLLERDQRVAELERSRAKETRALTNLEGQYRDQLAERNSLLATIWQRLSAFVGGEWSQKVSSGAMMPSMNFPLFSKNLLQCLHQLETLLSSFKIRCKDVERDLWKEYQNVETTIEAKTKKLSRLENIVKDLSNDKGSFKSDITKIKMEYKNLKTEYKEHLSKCQGGGLNSPAPQRDPDSNEKRWILRLKELEDRLKAETEGRIRDRKSAKDRLDELLTENTQMRKDASSPSPAVRKSKQ